MALQQDLRINAHAFASIATASHLAAAHVALASLGTHASQAQRYLFTLGITADDDATDAGTNRIAVENILDAPMLAAMAERYTAAELSCALKPVVMRWLARRGFAHLHYVDADVKFYADLAPLLAAVEGADIVLTPHCLQPFPQDSRRPRELTLLRGGTFNAGYVGVRAGPQGLRFLDWWAERVARRGFQDPARGMSGDQRWLDLAPALFPGLYILRHAGANVGYWNLHERDLSANAEGLRCGDDRLLFFHFSGFDPARPEELSVYQDRFDTAAQPLLARLLRDYADDLAAHGRQLPAPAPYPHRRWWHGSGWLRERYRRHRIARLLR